MARMSGNDEYPIGNFGDSSQMINCILDYGSTCHMTPDVLYFIPGLLEYTVKYKTSGVMWHVCLVMMNILLEILVTVHN